MWRYDKTLAGNRIRKQRMALGLKQDELAERIGKSTKYLADVERGNCGMSIDAMLQICDALSLSPNMLLLGEVTSEDASLAYIEELLANSTPQQRERIRKLLVLFFDL